MPPKNEKEIKDEELDEELDGSEEEEDGDDSGQEDKDGGEKREDKSLKNNEDGEEEAVGGDDEDKAKAEAKRQKNAEERRAKRERRRQKEHQDKETIRQLTGRLAQLESSTVGIAEHTVRREVSGIDSEVETLKRAIQNAEAAEIAAFNAGNAGEAIRARNAAFEGRERIRELSGRKAQITKAPDRTEQRQEQTNQQADPRIARHRSVFVENVIKPLNMDKWTQQDKAVVLELEKEIIVDGYDVRTRAFWDTFKERIEEEFPDKVTAKAATSPSKPRVSGGDTGSAGNGDPLEKGIPGDVLKAWRANGWKEFSKEQKLVARKSYFDGLKS